MSQKSHKSTPKGRKVPKVQKRKRDSADSDDNIFDSAPPSKQARRADAAVCTVHHHQSNLFCQNLVCMKLICEQCVQVGQAHHGHAFAIAAEAAEDVRKMVSDRLGELTGASKRTQSDSASIAFAQIKETFQSVLEALSARENRLLREVTELATPRPIPIPGLDQLASTATWSDTQVLEKLATIQKAVSDLPPHLAPGASVSACFDKRKMVIAIQAFGSVSTSIDFQNSQLDLSTRRAYVGSMIKVSFSIVDVSGHTLANQDMKRLGVCFQVNAKPIKAGPGSWAIGEDGLVYLSHVPTVKGSTVFTVRVGEKDISGSPAECTVLDCEEFRSPGSSGSLELQNNNRTIICRPSSVKPLEVVGSSMFTSGLCSVTFRIDDLGNQGGASSLGTVRIGVQHTNKADGRLIRSCYGSTQEGRTPLGQPWEVNDTVTMTIDHIAKRFVARHERTGKEHAMPIKSGPAYFFACLAGEYAQVSIISTRTNSSSPLKKLPG